MLLARWPESFPAGSNHDLSKRPSCRVFNQRLEALPDEIFALTVDVEVLDETAFSKFGGFSIAFTRQRVRLGEGPAAAEVIVNPRQLDLDEVVSAVASIRATTGTIDIVERIEKADVLTTAIITITMFVGLQTFSGFFNAAGAALFEMLRQQKRKDALAGPVVFHFHLHLDPNRRTPVVVLAIDPACTQHDIRSVDSQALLAGITSRVGQSRIQKVTAHLLPGGVIEIDHVTDEDGYVVSESAGHA